ncbi:MAG TPA: alpha/beta fold hydrolase [Aggregicoccus sp.]|nr:alpha/beta fold hydrolase [Aggregicoccus sp.]
MDLLGGVQKALRQMLVARGVESTLVRVHGQTLHSYRLKGEGSGPPVLLVHGLGGSANGFSRVLFGLAKRFRQVLAVDLPGHGFSPEVCGGPICVRAHFEALQGYCQQVVKEPAYVVGNSLGGAMAVELGAQAPELVRALALVAPAGADLPPGRIDAVLRDMIEVRSASDARALTRRLFHEAPLPALLFSHELRKFYGTPTVRALAQEALEARAALRPEVLGSLKMPTLLLWGASEKLLPYESLDYFRAHLPPHAKVKVVEGFGHVPQMERPAELVSHLVEFADEAGL